MCLVSPRPLGIHLHLRNIVTNLFSFTRHLLVSPTCRILISASSVERARFHKSPHLQGLQGLRASKKFWGLRPKPQIQNRKPETPNPTPKAQNTKSKTKNTTCNTQSPKSNTQNPTSKTQIQTPKHKTQDPNLKTQNPKATKSPHSAIQV